MDNISSSQDITLKDNNKKEYPIDTLKEFVNTILDRKCNKENISGNMPQLYNSLS